MESEVVGVHNGIIENYTELKEKLLKHGYTFYSQTDTEVVIKLVDYYYKKYNLGPIDAIAKTMVRVRGSYALELMFRDYPGEIWVARKDSPMIIGIADGETYVASDPVVCSKVCECTRCVLCGPWHRLCRLLGGKFEAERNQLHPLRSIRCWRTEARNY